MAEKIPQRNANRQIVRKLIGGVWKIVRAVAGTVCCCTAAGPQYKVRRCSDGQWVGWCTSTPPPFYFQCLTSPGGASCGCMFVGEEADPEDCDSAPAHTETELDSCDDCDYDENPDPEPPDEPDPDPCPCADLECTPVPDCTGTGGAANRWMVYIDGCTPKTCEANGQGAFITGDGAVNGAYAITCGPDPSVGIEAVSYADSGCDPELDRFGGAVVVMDDSGILVHNGFEIFASFSISGQFRCCLPNSFPGGNTSPLNFTFGGSAVAIPCQP